MSIDIHSEEGQIIRKLIPLSTLSINQFESLCNKIIVETAKPGTFVFKKNDIADDLIYLIEGSITLQSDELKVETIISGTESSRFALAHQIPRKIDAFTNTAVRFLRLNTNSIQSLPNESSNNSSKEDTSFIVFDETEPETEDKNDDDWITTLLKSPIFRALPPANLQKMIMDLDQVSFGKGESIVKQGDLGDSFYIIIKGKCQVSRKPSKNAKDINLAELKTQDTFGEDSLLTGELRNVNITALTDTKLLKLSKDKFISLIKDSTLKFIPHSKIEDELKNGAIFLDVRPPDEYKKFHLPNSKNTPFFSLRMHLKTFEKKSSIIVICADGKTSAAAAFLLLRSKFKALIVEGGIKQAAQHIKAASAVKDIVGKDKSKDSQQPISIAKFSVENNNLQNTLKLENKQLKLTIQKLSTEKSELETRYRNLYRQTEKLKSILDNLQNNKKKPD